MLFSDEHSRPDPTENDKWVNMCSLSPQVCVLQAAVNGVRGRARRHVSEHKRYVSDDSAGTSGWRWACVCVCVCSPEPAMRWEMTCS